MPVLSVNVLYCTVRKKLYDFDFVDVIYINCGVLQGLIDTLYKTQTWIEIIHKTALLPV